MRQALILSALMVLFPTSAWVTDVTVSTAAAAADNDPHFYLSRAATELKAKDYAAAEKDATEAMDLGYRKSSAFNTRAAARTGLGKFKEAFSDADLAVQVNPGSATGYLDRAAAREGMGSSHEEILADFEKAAELDQRWQKVYEDAKKRYGSPAKVFNGEIVAAGDTDVKLKASAPVTTAREPQASAQPPAEPAAAQVVSPSPSPVPSAPPPWKVILGAAAVVALLIVLIVKGFGRHAARRVRFGSVMSVPLPPGDEPSIGAVLGGRYILGKSAGQEDAADLFEARDLDDRPRVLKRLRRGDAALLARVKASGALRHAAIVTVESVFEQGGHIYLASEASAGEPLRLTIGRLANHRLAPEAAMRIVQAVCDALDFAHGRGIFHGHLTPAHIMVERAKVQLRGFALPPEPSESDYLAPEQDVGAGRAEGDIFSLGVCLYEMLTGARPFMGPEAGQNKREGRFTPASKVVPALAEGIDDLLARALAPDPAQRFHAAGELFGAFRILVIPGVH